MKYWLLFYFINIIVASCFHFSPVAFVYFWSSVAACDKTLKCRFSESDSVCSPSGCHWPKSQPFCDWLVAANIVTLVYVS